MSSLVLCFAFLPLVSLYPLHLAPKTNNYGGQAFVELAMRSAEMDVAERIADPAVVPNESVAASATQAPAVAIQTVTMTIIVDVPTETPTTLLPVLPVAAENEGSSKQFARWLMMVLICSGAIFICEKADTFDSNANPFSCIRVKKSGGKKRARTPRPKTMSGKSSNARSPAKTTSASTCIAAKTTSS